MIFEKLYVFLKLERRGLYARLLKLGHSETVYISPRRVAIAAYCFILCKESTKIEWFGLKEPVDVVDVPKLFGAFGMKLQDVMESAMNWVSKFVFKQLR